MYRATTLERKYMKHRGFTISNWYEIIPDCAPGREGVKWVSTKPIKLFGGYKVPAIWGEKCMGGNRFKNPLTREQSKLALQEVKESIDNIMDKVKEWYNCSDKEAVKIIKDT